MASAAADPLLPSEGEGEGRGGRRRLGFLPSSIRLNTSVWSELGGAVGDLGTYIPIVLALSLASHLDLGTTLIFTALYNFATGLLFGIPMPVQPMKSIAAVALSSAHLTVPQIMAAGLAVAAILLVLGATGLMTCMYRLLPLPVVRGVQLSQGLSFAFTAVKYVRYVQDFSRSSSASTAAARPLLGLDGLVLALAALLFIILATGSIDDEDVAVSDRRRRSCSRVPAALIVLALGLLLCFVRDPSILRGLRFGPAPLWLVGITWDDFKVGLAPAVRAQLGHRGVQALVGSLPGARRALPGAGVRERRPHELRRLLVRRHAVLPRRGRAGGAVPVRRPEWRVRGVFGHRQAGAGARVRELVRDHPRPVPDRDTGRHAALLRDRARHGVARHGYQGGVLRHAYHRRRVAHGLQRRRAGVHHGDCSVPAAAPQGRGLPSAGRPLGLWLAASREQSCRRRRC